MTETKNASEIIDVNVENHGTMFLFRLETEQAKTWVEENTGDDTNWFAGALVVEARYARDLAKGMLRDGLVVR